MAVTLTVAQLAAAIRLTTSATVAPAEPELSILHRQLRVAESRIDLYAPAADDDTKDEAAILMVGYLYDAPPVQRNPAIAFQAKWSPGPSCAVARSCNRQCGRRGNPCCRHS